MVFSSLLFIFTFLPITLLLYYVVPKRFRNLVLMICSMVFYSWGEVRFFPIMLALITTNYLCALFIERCDDNDKLRKLLLALSVLSSLGILAFFKYTNFFIGNINSVFGVSLGTLELTLPLGISFYTFQTMGYTIDVYRRTVPAERSFIDLAAFISMFPQLIAGPIVRYTDVRRALVEREITLDGIESGIEDFVIGLARKVLIANNVGMLWSEVENLGFGAVSGGLAWLGVLAFSLQIYFDFSGYSQMAIGLGRMLGFDFPPNFDSPYSSRSVTEFWRRWHMTLGTWFRDYVYFPLGGSRFGRTRTFINLFIVWALTGLWHGASWNFVLWGLYFFVLIAIEKAGFMGVLNKHRVLSRVYMALVLLVGWALFAVTDFAQLGVLFSKMFTPAALFDRQSSVGALYYLRNYGVTLLLGLFFSFKVSAKLYSKIRVNTWLRAGLMLVLFLLSVAYLVDSTYNPFLYFRF